MFSMFKIKFCLVHSESKITDDDNLLRFHDVDISNLVGLTYVQQIRYIINKKMYLKRKREQITDSNQITFLFVTN